MDREIDFPITFLRIGSFVKYFPKKKQREISKSKYLRELAKTFQRRFRQELVDGKIDQECLLISKNIIKA